MLLAQKSKPVAIGRKRKRHDLAAIPGQADAEMEQEEVKHDEDEAEPVSQHQAGVEPKRSKRNKTQINPDGSAMH